MQAHKKDFPLESNCGEATWPGLFHFNEQGMGWFGTDDVVCCCSCLSAGTSCIGTLGPTSFALQPSSTNQLQQQDV